MDLTLTVSNQALYREVRGCVYNGLRQFAHDLINRIHQTGLHLEIACHPEDYADVLAGQDPHEHTYIADEPQRIAGVPVKTDYAIEQGKPVLRCTWSWAL